MNKRFGIVDRLMREAVAQRFFPGAVLRVSSRNAAVFQKCYGMADLFRGRVMTADTLFDLASLTKPLATTLAAVVLVQQGRLDLDRPCRDYWPSFDGGGRERITPRLLLCHRSGLPAWRPFFLRLCRTPRREIQSQLRRWVVQEPLEASVGQRVLYSDLGFWVLQWIIEQIAEERLDRFLTTYVWLPMGIDHMFFIDLEQPRPEGPFAATELCPHRGRLLVGEVHDDHAHFMGGVAGHAGLFGTADAVGAMLRCLMRTAWGNESHPVFDSKVLQHFFQKQADTSWALGFDTPAQEASNAGSRFSKVSLGHLGFTGTSFWMDPIQDIVVILLTNRVHPTRYTHCIRRFRGRLHDAVVEAVTRDRM